MLVSGEGNGSPLQCSVLENPRDGGAWWAAVYGVAQSRTRLKRLSSVGFCHTTTQISHNYTYTRSRSPVPPGHHGAPAWAPCTALQLHQEGGKWSVIPFAVSPETLKMCLCFVY